MINKLKNLGRKPEPAKPAPAKKPVKKAAPRKPAEKSEELTFADPAEQAAFEQGVAARRGSIAKEDAPHGDGPLLKLWLKGWKHAGNG